MRLDDHGLNLADSETADAKVNSVAAWFGRRFARNAATYQLTLAHNFRADLGDKSSVTRLPLTLHMS